MKDLRSGVKYIQVSKIEVPDDLEFQVDYRIELIGTVVKKEQKDAQDGSGDVLFKIKPTSVEIEKYV